MSTLSTFLNNKSRKRSSRRSTRITRLCDTDWRLSPSVTGPRGDAGWILTTSVLSWRVYDGWRLTPRMLGRRRTSCNAGTDSCVSSHSGTGGCVFRTAEELKIVSQHDVLYVSTSKNFKVDFCSELRSIFRGSGVQLSLRSEFE